MPGINVVDRDGDLQRLPDGSSWHIDDRGQLHIKNGTIPVASFAKDCWQGVVTEDEVGPADRQTLDDVARELREANARLCALEQVIRVADRRTVK